MLLDRDKPEINLIERTIKEVFVNNVEFGEFKELDSPYPEFEWSLKLYDKVNVRLFYDRSALDIGVPKNGEYVLMSEYTTQPFIRGMKATLPENLLNNFRVLDDVAKCILHEKPC